MSADLSQLVSEANEILAKPELTTDYLRAAELRENIVAMLTSFVERLEEIS